MKELYNQKQKEVTDNITKEKEDAINALSNEAEEAARLGAMKKVYQETKKLSGENAPKRMSCVKSKDGSLLTKQEDIEKRWAEHFEDVLNRPEPDELDESLDEQVSQAVALDVNLEPPNRDEIRKVIGKLKMSKSPGVDGIAGEMLKAGGERMIDELQALFREVFQCEKQPTDFKEGVIESTLTTTKLNLKLKNGKKRL